MVRNLKESEFDIEVLSNEKLVMVDFYATWCPPCKMLSPVLDELASSRGEYKIVKIDVDECKGLASKYRINAVPTVLFFKAGNIVEKFEGFRSRDEVANLIQKHV